MVLEERYKDVTFETLNRPDFLESVEQALQKAELEFEKFHHQQLTLPSQVEKDFEAAVKKLKKLPAPGRKKKKP